MEPTLEKRSTGLPILVFFFILLGAGLILIKTASIHYGWGIILWICLGVVGVVAVCTGIYHTTTGRSFLGSLVFFVSRNYDLLTDLYS